MIPGATTDVDVRLGWAVLAIAAIFTSGLSPQSVFRRLAAPAIFGSLAIACFAGAGFAAMTLTAGIAVGIVVLGRWQEHRRVA